jgi:hypothetical protein
VIRDSVFISPDCFGPYHNETYDLQIRSTQRMVYEGTDSETPCYMGCCRKGKLKSRQEEQKGGE